MNLSLFINCSLTVRLKIRFWQTLSQALPAKWGRGAWGLQFNSPRCLFQDTAHRYATILRHITANTVVDGICATAKHNIGLNYTASLNKIWGLCIHYFACVSQTNWLHWLIMQLVIADPNAISRKLSRHQHLWPLTSRVHMEILYIFELAHALVCVGTVTRLCMVYECIIDW